MILKPYFVSILILFSLIVNIILSKGIVANMNCGNDKMTTMIGLVSRFIFNVPWVGAIFRLFGMDSVDPINLAYLMKNGKTIGILPGGFE